MNSALIQFARIKHLILRSDLRHAIQTIALNHLHYCTLVWSTAGTYATATIQRSLRMAERLACSQFKDLNLLCREKIKVLRSRITQKRSSHYINNCLLLNPKVEQKNRWQGENMARISLYFDVCCECFLFFCCFFPFYVTAYSAENHASMSGFKSNLNLNIRCTTSPQCLLNQSKKQNRSTGKWKCYTPVLIYQFDKSSLLASTPSSLPDL